MGKDSLKKYSSFTHKDRLNIQKYEPIWYNNVVERQPTWEHFWEDVLWEMAGTPRSISNNFFIWNNNDHLCAE